MMGTFIILFVNSSRHFAFSTLLDPICLPRRSSVSLAGHYASRKAVVRGSGLVVACHAQRVTGRTSAATIGLDYVTHELLTLQFMSIIIIVLFQRDRGAGA
jgi:hypothetical protein